MIRRGLDNIYWATALLGAFFILMILVLITIQVVGREFGVQVKGTDDLTAWSVVAAGFLPLAYTFRTAGHIRVTLFVDRMRGTLEQVWGAAVLLLALFFTGYLAYSSIDMVHDSIRFGDLSQGLLTVPLWIPQISLPLGSLVLTIAIADDLIVLLAGGNPYRLAEARGVQILSEQE